MATARLLDQYRTPEAYVVHLAVDNEVTVNINGASVPSSLEYRIEIPIDTLMNLTNAQIRQKVLDKLRELRLQRGTVGLDRTNVPSLPATMTVGNN